MPPSLSVIVPAFNEEDNLAATVAEVLREIPRHFPDHEVLVVDDGSRDRTGEIADALALGDARVRALHNPATQGLGGAYLRGVAEASKDYVLMVPGDNEIRLDGMAGMWGLVGSVDIVLSYTANPEIRPWSRRSFTRFGTWFLNALFGLDLRYYNGCAVQRVSALRGLSVGTRGFLYQGEILVRMIRRGATYAEVGIPLRPRAAGRSKVLRARNVLSVLGTVARLFWEVRILARA